MDKNLSKSVKSPMSEQIALTTMFYFGQVFFLLKVNQQKHVGMVSTNNTKEHTLRRSTNIFSSNYPTLCFWLRREGRYMLNTEQLLHQTGKNSHRRCSIKKAVLKIFCNIHRKTPVFELFLNKVACL